MIRVRKASLKDSRAVSRLLKQKYNFNSLAEARAAFVAEFWHGNHFRIADINGKVVSLASWCPESRLKYGVVELTRLAVDNTLSSPHEVKEALFDVIMAEADYYYKEHGYHLRKVFSLIHADNKQVKEFFVDKGMRQEAILKNHFYPGRDELVFSLFLA